MASNYRVTGTVYPASTDLDDIFEEYVSGTKAPVSGFSVLGVNFSDRFTRLADGLRGPNVGITENGVDLSLIYATDVSNYTLALGTSSLRTTPWTGSVVHEFTVTFASEQARTDYFLYSGEIRFSGSREGGPSNLQNQSWSDLLDGIGVVRFGDMETVNTGMIGAPALIGNLDLTGSYQTIFTASGVGVYSGDLYQIEARQDSATVLRFRITFTETNDLNPSFNEEVSGDLESVIQSFRHQLGTLAPSYSNTVNL